MFVVSHSHSMPHCEEPGSSSVFSAELPPSFSLDRCKELLLLKCSSALVFGSSPVMEMNILTVLNQAITSDDCAYLVSNPLTQFLSAVRFCKIHHEWWLKFLVLLSLGLFTNRSKYFSCAFLSLSHLFLSTMAINLFSDLLFHDQSTLYSQLFSLQKSLIGKGKEFCGNFSDVIIFLKKVYYFKAHFSPHQLD